MRTVKLHFEVMGPVDKLFQENGLMNVASDAAAAALRWANSSATAHVTVLKAPPREGELPGCVASGCAFKYIFPPMIALAFFMTMQIVVLAGQSFLFLS